MAEYKRVKKMSDGDIQVFGSRMFIGDATIELLDLGFDVGQTISDFRNSRLYTNAPMDVVEGVLERLETK